MNIKEVKCKVDNFVPPTGFNAFFKEWKEEQVRTGFNWSVKSEELFRQSMLTGMVFVNEPLEVEDEEPVAEEIPLKGTETGRTRSRATEEVAEPVAEERSRTRTRTRAS